ncbi:MAG: hypothetical protein CFE35_02805 [Novosphingobium sp. PASSN1]|nr:MAG: hypothetical protein CFE35_02805 [Novosphingobium sp. PASSN1]
MRVVTREEVLAICERLLGRVDAALTEWQRVGLRNDCLEDGAIAAAEARRAELARMIAADQFTELQKAAPREEAFLRQDIQERLGVAARRLAEARSRDRRAREAGVTLLRTLRAREAPIDNELAAKIERGDTAALSKGFDLLAAEPNNLTTNLELAGKLQTNGQGKTFADWLALHAPPPLDPLVEVIALRLDTLKHLVSDEMLAGWQVRLDEAENAPLARRALVLDGLTVETARVHEAEEGRAAALFDLRLLLAEASAAGIVVADVGRIEDSAITDIEARKAEIKTILDAHERETAAAARRAAVLDGLAGLGYKVSEGMTTTLAQEGRLVVRSAARQDYGVEITAPAGATRIQMAPIAFTLGGAGPDPARDRDAETIWCSEVTELGARLAKAQGELVIENSLPIGARALKRIADREREARESVAAPELKGRSLQ